MTDAPSPRPSLERPLLALLLLLLGAAQLVLTRGSHEMGVDGGYYLDVAMHVRDGMGLRSDVSLYHQGFPWFPYPSPIYPLWPLLLGHLGRLVEITWLAHWLPYALWLGSLLAAFAFGRALLPADLWRRLPGVHGGHLALLMLGTQREYSRHTTMPYTEGLGFLLLMVALWRLVRAPPTLRRGLEVGLWVALACLTRSQLFILPLALGLGLGIVALLGGPAGRRWLGPGAAALGVVLLALAGWWASVADTVVDASPFTLLRFDQARASTALAPLDVMRNDDSALDLLLDRLSGLKVAWSLSDWDQSYARGFFAWHWALPAALLGLPFALWGRTKQLRSFFARPEALAWTVVVLVALGGLASIHLPHKEGFGTWYFHRRHAVICVLAFYLGMALLLRHRHLLFRLGGLAILISSLGYTGDSLYWRVNRALEPAPADNDRAIVRWLQGRVKAEGTVTVAMYAFKPPELAWRTELVGYHWFYERTSLQDLTVMFDELGADYLVFPHNGTRKWRFRKDEKAFSRQFQRSETSVGGLRIYTRRPAEQRAAAQEPPTDPGSEPAEADSDPAEPSAPQEGD